MAVYFFYGEEDYNIDLELEKMSSKLNPDFKSMSLQILDNPDFSTLINALRTTPMMFGDMLTIINAEDYFLSNKKTFEDKELDEIEDALKNNPETLNIVFVVKLPRNEKKTPDARRKLYKIVSKYNKKEFPVISPFKTAEIANWIKLHAKSKGISLNSEAIELLVDSIGNNLRELDIELDKLKLLAYPETNITKNMVSEICTSNEDLFALTEMLMIGARDKALLEFKKLLDKKHPLEILSAVQTMLRKWIIIKTNKSRSTEELVKLTGMKEYGIKQTLLKLKNTSIADIVKLKENLFKTEYKIKSAEALDIESEVECALIR